MKTLTQKQSKQHGKLAKACHVAANAIFACAGNDHTPFSECWQMADEGTRQYWLDTQASLQQFEDAMISEGRAYRTAGGGFRAS